MTRRILKGGRLIDPARDLDEPGALVIEGGRIAACVPASEGEPAVGADDEVEELDGRWIVPGFVDLRATLGEPGREHREDLQTGLTAAAAGGFVAVCATPDSKPVLDGPAVARQIAERAAAVGKARLWPVAAATVGLAGEELPPFGELADAGCVAVSAGEWPIANPRMARRVMEYASAFELPVMVSAVDHGLGEGMCDEGRWSTRLGLPGSPALAERIAVEREVALAELTGTRVHLSRLSTADAVDVVRRAKARGVPVTCDVTPHHLHLTAAALAEYDTDKKVWPPLRSERDVAALREALSDGTVDAVATDHRPLHREEKDCEFMLAREGVIGLETALPMLLKLVDGGALTALALVRLLAAGPRAVLGAGGGTLAAGELADVTVVDPGFSWLVDAGALRSRSKNSPWLGQAMTGRAVKTLVAGEPVWQIGGDR